MPDDPVRILLVEDSNTEATIVKERLSDALTIDYSLSHAASLAPAIESLRRDPVSFILADLNLPDSQGLETFRSIRAAAPLVPIIIHSGEGDEELAVTAVREGAEDYLVKSCYDGAQMARCIRFAVERSRRVHAEREVNAAARVQQDLYPNRDVEIDGFDIAGEAFPAVEAGGDYFDFIPMTDDSLGVVVGDVSGHGLGPAMRMAETRAYLRALTDIWAHLRALAKSSVDPGDVLTHLNRLLTADRQETFISMFFGVIDTNNRTLTYASGGHPGYLLRAAGDAEPLESTNPPVGAVEGVVLSSIDPVRLETGDLLVLPTDGIVESANTDRELFGVERVLAVAREQRNRPARDIVQAIYQAARDFSVGAPQVDDLTAVIVRAV